VAVTDNLNALELARIARIAGTAAFRGGVLTTRQQNRIDAIINAANKREAAKRAKP
jgi:hypothetical protein